MLRSLLFSLSQESFLVAIEQRNNCYLIFWIIGEVIDAKNRCKRCLGKKVIEETKILEVLYDFFIQNKKM